jgi:putative DNA primase/helicase
MALANILIKNGFNDSEIAAIIRNSKTGTEKKITKGYLAITIKKSRAFFKEKRVKGIPGIRGEYFRATDLKNSENFSIKYVGQLIYCQPWNNWLIYNEGKWEIESKRETQELAKRVILDYYKEASEMLDDRTRQNLIKEALKCESQRAIRAMIELATSGIAAVPDDFDQDIYIFNLENGTMDLKTLEFREHRPEDMLTKIANVSYNPEADCPKWLAFLDKIFEGNEDLINYLQASLGYSLTGDIGEQCLFILYGPTGWNGKSTFISTTQEILGDYAISTPFETFLTRRGEHIPNDLARMRGARFVTAIEAGEGKNFNEELLKRLTGRDKITARFLRQEYFEFYPICKLWLATNHKPAVREFSPSFWGRIRLIPFKLTIPEEERIPHYEETLLEEKEGIFNWILEGYKRWKEDRLRTPDEIKEATAEYKSSMDVVAEFIEGCCVESHREKITTKELYKAYKDWCDVSGEKPVNKNTFGRRLTERGYKSIKIGHKNERGWLGIALKDEDADLPFNEN